MFLRLHMSIVEIFCFFFLFYFLEIIPRRGKSFGFHWTIKAKANVFQWTQNEEKNVSLRFRHIKIVKEKTTVTSIEMNCLCEITYDKKPQKTTTVPK